MSTPDRSSTQRTFVTDESFVPRATAAMMRRSIFTPQRIVLLALFFLAIIIPAALTGDPLFLLYLGVAIVAVIALVVRLRFRLLSAFRKTVPVGTRYAMGLGASGIRWRTPNSQNTVTYSTYDRVLRQGDFVFLRQKRSRRWLLLPGELMTDEMITTVRERIAAA